MDFFILNCFANLSLQDFVSRFTLILGYAIPEILYKLIFSFWVQSSASPAFDIGIPVGRPKFFALLVWSWLAVCFRQLCQKISLKLPVFQFEFFVLSKGG